MFYSKWEATFKSWAQAPSPTEQAKCDNAERAITKAINSYDRFRYRNITVFPQGSYRNRTNVRIDSDVDICVLCTDSLFSTVPSGMTKEQFGLEPATYKYNDYKNDVQSALTSYFDYQSITRGNKAFEVRENTYRVNADVVACFEFHSYRSDGTYLQGTGFIPDNKIFRVVNWPNQNYENGVRKNTITGRRFKALVRILKHTRNQMKKAAITTADYVPSYLIECLVWNVPNDRFGDLHYADDVRSVIGWLYTRTMNDDGCKEWGEINELKYLFRPSQPWSRQQANNFLFNAWKYLGLD